MQIGCLARFENPYPDEVAFAREHGFALVQVWYDRDGLQRDSDVRSCMETIKRCDFPAIIHAVLDLNEFDEHIPRLAAMLEFLGHREVIVHPICRSEPLDEGSIHRLAEKVERALEVLTPRGVTMYLENNSRLEPIFASPAELSVVFARNPGLELILDVAHVTSYEHLAALVAVRMPRILHVADKHFDVVHEHLPLGQGEIDFGRVFRDVLPGFDGRVILELPYGDEEVVRSKTVLEGWVLGRR